MALLVVVLVAVAVVVKVAWDNGASGDNVAAFNWS